MKDYFEEAKSWIVEGEGNILRDGTSRNKEMTKKFSKYLKEFNENDYVWLQDKTGNYQGYYKVVNKNNKKEFEYVGSISEPTTEKEIPVLKED